MIRFIHLPCVTISQNKSYKRSGPMSKHPIGAGKSSFDLMDSDAFFKALHLASGMTVLDLACGARPTVADSAVASA